MRFLLCLLLLLCSVQRSWSASLECSKVEEAFRNRILAIIQNSKEKYQGTGFCLLKANSNAATCASGETSLAAQMGEYQDIVKQLAIQEKSSLSDSCEKASQDALSELKEYRQTIKELYQEMADDWVKKRDAQTGGMTSACFLGSGKSVRFEDHIRNLHHVIDDPTACVGEDSQWMEYRNSMEDKILNAEIVSRKISAARIKKLKEMRSSSWVNEIPDEALYRQSLSDEQLKKYLGGAMMNLQDSIAQYQKRILALPAREGYQLFEFREQYEIYKKTLSPEEAKTAERCQAAAGPVGALRDCMGINKSSGGRCASRLFAGIASMTPWGIIEGYRDFQDAHAAYAAGAMTKNEATEKQVSGAMAVVSSVVGGVGVAGAAEKAGAKLSASAAKNFSGLSLSNPKIAMTVTEKELMLAESSGMTLAQRLSKAGEIIGRPLTTREQKAIEAAHLAGPMNENLAGKMRILREAGFSSQEADMLMRRGITGSWDSPGVTGAVELHTATAPQVTSGNALEATPKIWKYAENAFGVETGHPDTAAAINYLEAQYSQVARVLPQSRPMEQNLAWVLSRPKDRDMFLRSLNQDDAKEIIQQLRQQIRNEPVINHAPSGGNELHWYELGQWRRQRINEAIDILSKK